MERGDWKFLLGVVFVEGKGREGGRPNLDCK